MSTLLAQARLRACGHWPFASHAILSMVPVPRPGLGTLAVDKHWRLYYDADRSACDRFACQRIANRSGDRASPFNDDHRAIAVHPHTFVSSLRRIIWCRPVYENC